MSPIVTQSNKPEPVGFVTRLERWGAPVPAEYASLLPRFLVARRAELAALIVPSFRAYFLFFLFFTLTDVLLYFRVLVPLLMLRAVLLGTILVGWVGMRRLRRNRGVNSFLSIMFAISAASICLMLVLIRVPTGLYAMALLCMIPVIAMMPWPRFWYLVNSGAVVILYTATMTATGMIWELNVFQIVVAMLGAMVIFGVLHAYADYQRWVSFLNHTRSQDLGARLQGELTLAQRIQRGLLQPSTPSWPGLDLVCWSAAAREVGGDFYAYMRSADGRVSLAVGDVSGKGLPAALLMGTSLAYLRAASGNASSPGALLTHLDRVLADTTRATRQNCALCCVELDGGQLRAANAGGVSPLLRHADGRVCWIEVGGLPLGTGLGKLGYSDVCVDIAPGDMLVLVSDGVVEAMDELGQIFGFDRLEAAVAACDSSSAFVFVAELRDALAGFMGLAEAHDDMTIVALRVTG